MKKHFTAHVIFAATALASQQVWALGFGRSVSDAVLGQSFTFTVPVHVDAGERLGPDCVSAQVFYGDTPLPAGAVRTELVPGDTDGDWRVRITASAPVTEPIIEVALGAGCERRFTRRFSVFADPPTIGTTAAQVAPPAANPAPAIAPMPAAPRVAGAGAEPARRPHAAARKQGSMALTGELDAPSRRPAAGNVGANRAGTRTAPAPVETPRLLLDAGVPHLKLDMEEPIIPPPAAASGAAAASASVDDGDLHQLQALQQSLDSARRDTQAQREQTAMLQAELAQARARTRDDSAPWLLGLLAIAAAAIAGLVWKLRQQTRVAHSDWFNQSALGPATAVPPASELPPEATSSDALPAPEAYESAFAVPAQEPLPELAPVDDGDARGIPVVDHSATRPLDRHAFAAALPQGAPRELSVEELLDLEQQADFFIALGQEDAAVDLLMSHLRSAGGQSPLPYTKLLEIYKRQGDRSAYERTRARFNRRFNAYAPDWDTGPAAGRSLEDYPETVAQLQRAWHSPIDAMAILESLLFKRDDSSELFDLPAYRDVLVLYSLARDLWQHGGQSGTQVDVLLPLDDGARLTAWPAAGDAGTHALAPHDPGPAGESLDIGGDTRNGMLTSFEMSGYDTGRQGADLDLDLPPGPDVHVTLDGLSLAPVAPTRPKPDPRAWRDSSDKPDSDLPSEP